jgi:hypothetical protein
MASGYVRRATVEDAVRIAPLLRQADREECLLIAGMAPEALLPAAVAAAPDHTHTMVANDGSLLGLFGVTGLPVEGVGAVWMLATDDLPAHATTFLRESRRWVERLQGDYPVLVNVTDSRNTTHHRWIEWCGFTLLGRRNTPAGIPIIEFAKAKP